MTAPRRPAPSRRAGRTAARGPGSSRPLARPPRTTARAGAVRTAGPRPARAPAAAVPAARRSGLTTRAAVLALVVVALVVSAAIPLREYLAQRSEISVLLSERRAAEQRLAELEAARARLDDPAFITSEARRRLHFVLPGETAYVVLAPPAQADPAAEEAAQAPWWSQVWGSVEAADAPPPPAP